MSSAGGPILISVTIAIVIALSTTTIQTSKRTAQQLREIMKEIGAKTYDEAIRELIEGRRTTPESLFGSNPRLRPFTARDEAESRERRRKVG
jgi:hypothetical protein